MKTTKCFFLFALFFLFFSLFVSCGDGAGSGDSGEPPTSISYTGKKAAIPTPATVTIKCPTMISYSSG